MCTCIKHESGVLTSSVSNVLQNLKNNSFLYISDMVKNSLLVRVTA